MSSDYNPYMGFNSPYYPGYAQSYDRCSCGGPEACGNEHAPAVKVVQVSRATRGGKSETVNVVQPIGEYYRHLGVTPYSTWDGSLAMSDLKPPRYKPYRPPALPFICDRPLQGSSLCTISSPCHP
jgi:hypothetical protein